MYKKEIYNYLNKNNITYEITEHPAMFSMNEISTVKLPYPDVDAKNLFVRDDKKQNYYLITVKGNKRVNLKEFKKKYNLRSLSFASEEDLKNILKLTSGSVSPFGLLNDENKIVSFYIDKDFENGLIGIHPNDNTATVWLNVNDLINIIKQNGNTVNIAELN